jgi:hypothetical protein
MANHPNLDRLNELLKQTNLGLPAHRTSVNASGHNLKFLRKALPSNDKCPQEIKDLLAMADKDLMAVPKKVTA